MAAALVEGIPFQKNSRGYWSPVYTVDNEHNATIVLWKVVRALGFNSIEAYLRWSSSHPDDIKARIAALKTVENT